MSQLLEYDPLHGISRYFDHDEATGITTLTTKQNVDPVLEYNKKLANAGATDKGIKESWWLYAKIPALVELQMRKKGIKLNEPGATKRIIQEINEHYPALKTTQKWDGKRAATQFYLPPTVSDAVE